MDVRMIENRISANKKLIAIDNLLLPSATDIAVSDITSSYIHDYKVLEGGTLSSSSYDDEIAKVFLKLTNFFGDEIVQTARTILEKISVMQVMPKDVYTVTFKFSGQYPWSLNLPRELHNLSHIYIGHELIHILKDTNSKEWVNLLRYAEVLPQLYEFIQMRYQRIGVRRNIINFRMKQLQDMQNKVIEAKETSYFIGKQDDFKNYILPEQSYFISFYYAILLYRLYTSYPKEVLIQIKKVLLHEKTTKDVLEYFEIDDNWDLFEFAEGYQKLLKKVI